MRTKHERPTSQPPGNANANNQRGALNASNQIKRNVGKNEMCYLLKICLARLLARHVDLRDQRLNAAVGR